jgi:hypothetical protein
MTVSATEVPVIIPRPIIAPSEQTALEAPWNLNDVIKRPYMVMTTNWSSTDAVGNVIATAQFPQFFYTQPILANIWNTFNISRFKISVTLTLTGTKFHQGCLMASWRPFATGNDGEVPSVDSLYLTPHAFLRADCPNTVTIEIPFIYDAAYYPHYMSADDDPFGCLYLVVFSGLAYATGASPVLTVSTTCQIDTIDFHLPRTPFSTSVPSLMSGASKTTLAKTNALPDDSRKKRIVEQQSENVIAGGGTDKSPILVGRSLQKNSPQRDRVNSYRDLCKRVFPLAKMVSTNTSFGDNNDNVFLCRPMMFDASLVWNPQFNVCPAAAIGNMYKLAKGSVRYELDLSLNATATQLPSNLHAFMMFLPKYFPIQLASGNSIYTNFYDQALTNQLAPIAVIDPLFGPPYDEIYSDIVRLFPGPTTNYYNLGGEIDITAISYSPYNCFAPVVGTPNGFSCSLAIEVPFVHHRHSYRVPTVYTGGYNPYTNAYPTDGPFPASGAMHSDSPYAALSAFGPAHSPGTVVFGLICPTTNLNSTATAPVSQLLAELHGSLGDDFRFGCLANLSSVQMITERISGTAIPGMNVDQFNPFLLRKERQKAADARTKNIDGTEANHAFNNLVDETPFLVKVAPKTPVREVEQQGNTIHVMNKFLGPINGTVPINTTGDSFDAKATLSIPAEALATAMDKPTMNVQMPGNKIYQFNWRANDTGIFYGERAAIVGSDVDEAMPGDFGTEADEMSFAYLRSIPGVVAAGTFTTTQSTGQLIMSIPISPLTLINDFSQDAFGEPVVDTPYRMTMLGQTCIPFVFWRGGLCYRFRIFASGFHTGKLFLSINYHPFRNSQPSTTTTSNFVEVTPDSFISAMSQYGAYIDLSESQHDLTFQVEYVSHETFTYVQHFSGNRRNNIGTISLWVVQPLVAVPGTQPSVDFVMEAWAAPDFETHTISPQACTWSDQPTA